MPAVAMLIGYAVAYCSLILFALWLIALLTDEGEETSRHR